METCRGFFVYAAEQHLWLKETGALHALNPD